MVVYISPITNKLSQKLLRYGTYEMHATCNELMAQN